MYKLFDSHGTTHYEATFLPNLKERRRLLLVSILLNQKTLLHMSASLPKLKLSDVDTAVASLSSPSQIPCPH